MQEGGYSAKNGAKDSAVMRGPGAEAGDDFPMVCETCLGQNPYVRMVKLPFGQKLCTVSQVPYQAFRWKAGPKGRYKETIISYVVAHDRNICQACLNDMKYGLPVGIRDKLLKESHNQVVVPHSDVGQRFYYEQQAQLQSSNQDETISMSTELANVGPSNQMIKFAQLHQEKEAGRTAFRNLPKLCSFWVGGGCLRVKRKACPFRPCCGAFVFPELAATHRDLMTELIKQLEADGPEKVQTNISDECRAALKNSSKVNKEQAIRKRVHGEDELTAKYLGKMNSMKGIKLDPPADPNITTLWVGNLLPDMTQEDLRDVFYAYGHIQSVHIVPKSKCAFVEYTDRAAAEYAASQLHNNCVIKGRSLSLNWAKPRAQSLSGNSIEYEGQTTDKSTGIMLPPGVDDLSKYNLQAHTQIFGQPPLPMNSPPVNNSSMAPRPPPPPGAFTYLPNPSVNSAPIIESTAPAAKKPKYSSMDPTQLGAKY